VSANNRFALLRCSTETFLGAWGVQRRPGRFGFTPALTAAVPTAAGSERVVVGTVGRRRAREPQRLERLCPRAALHRSGTPVCNASAWSVPPISALSAA
jgi:hypothetical protein